MLWLIYTKKFFRSSEKWRFKNQPSDVTELKIKRNKIKEKDDYVIKKNKRCAQLAYHGSTF